MLTLMNQSHGKVLSKALAGLLVSQFRKVIELQVNAVVKPEKKEKGISFQPDHLSEVTYPVVKLM